MAYNTNNPIGSTDPRDLYDNAQNLDELVNSASKLIQPDRFGVSRFTWNGIEERFADFLASSGYQFTGDYAAGITITEYNQIVRDSGGEFWRLAGTTEIPYTTTGSGLPEGSAFIPLGDAVLRQELALEDGADLVGFIQPHPSAVIRTILDKSREIVTPYDFGATGDGVTNDTVALQSAIDFASSIGGGSVLLRGSFAYSSDIVVKEKVVLIGQGGFRSYSLVNLSPSASIVLLGGIRIRDVSVSAPNNFAGILVKIGNGASSTNNQNPISIDNFALFGTSGFVQGTAFEISPSFTPGRPVTFISANGLKIRDFALAINLSPSVAGNWANGNYFTNLAISTCRQYIRCNKTADCEVSGNFFHGAIQANASVNDTETPGIYVNGNFNVFDVFVWDWQAAWDSPWIHVTEGCLNTELRRCTLPEQINNDSKSTILGATFQDRVNHSSFPMLPLFAGSAGVNYEDSDLSAAHKRFAVSYSVAPSSGEGNMFSRQGNATTSWAAFSGNVDIVVDFSSGVETYAPTQILGLGATFTVGPDSIEFYVQNATTSEWKQLEFRTFNFSRYYAYCLLSDYTRQTNIKAVMLRLTNNTSKSVSVSHFFGRTSSIRQGTYLPTLGGRVWGDMFLPKNAFNDSRIVLGNNYIWVDSFGKLRIKTGTPTSDTDGVVVGTQA